MCCSSSQATRAWRCRPIKIRGPKGKSITVGISDLASKIATLTESQIAALPPTGVTRITVSNDADLTLSVAQAQALEANSFELKAQAGYSAAISDSAADIETLTTKQIAGFAALDVTQIIATDASVSLTVAQAKALESANVRVSAPAGDTVQIYDTAKSLESLTASQIDGLTAIGVTGLVSTNADVSYSTSQTSAILSSRLNVSASGPYTVTENRSDGSYDVDHFDVTGKAYSSYEDIYNSAGKLVADAQENVNGTGSLLLYANGLTVMSSSGTESVTTGSDTFTVHPHSVETTTVENGKSNETFVYGSGFVQDTLIGFLETSGAHDLLQFSDSMFGFSPGSSQTADAQALLSNYASGTTNTTITDLQRDMLTINNHSISTFKNNLEDFKFT
jgi:hypothetical protein